MKKCPVCNSSSINQVKWMPKGNKVLVLTFQCNKCRYVNKGIDHDKM